MRRVRYRCWAVIVIGMGDGDFGLFRRAIREDKGVRELVYDTDFSVGDQQYRMRGRKYVEPSPPWRVWPATTTLYVQLFPVGGGTGEPVAAGVLRITLWAFIRQLLSMQVIGNFGWFDRCSQKLSFYRFFVSSHWSTRTSRAGGGERRGTRRRRHHRQWVRRCRCRPAGWPPPAEGWWCWNAGATGRRPRHPSGRATTSTPAGCRTG